MKEGKDGGGSFTSRRKPGSSAKRVFFEHGGTVDSTEFTLLYDDPTQFQAGEFQLVIEHDRANKNVISSIEFFGA